MQKKAIIIMSQITPTRTWLFNEMYKYFSHIWYDLKIIFTSRIEWNRKWDTTQETKKFLFPFEILEGKQIQNTSKKDSHFFHINHRFKKILEKENPDTIIHAWRASLSAFEACLRAKKHKKKFILWSGSTKYEKSWRRTLTKPLVKWLVKNSTSYRSYGTRASEYLVSLWADPDKIYKLYNTVDVDFFIKQAEELKPKRNNLKKELWIKNKHILLFVWQLIKRKWVYELLEWYHLFKKENPDTDLWLVLVGSWQEEETLKKIVKEKNIDSIYFAGYKQKHEISEYFAIADIFTLPSHEEVWWLVINEAMCFGLPIITTKYVGASVDLIEEWKNGYIMKENTWDEFEKWMKFIFENDLIEKNNSLEIIEDFSPQKIIKRLEII